MLGPYGCGPGNGHSQGACRRTWQGARLEPREQEESKDFFFEKKKQKTFAIWAEPARRVRSQVAKVFWFFFSKKNRFLYASRG
jgi:hypothetical protein